MFATVELGLPCTSATVFKSTQWDFSDSGMTVTDEEFGFHQSVFTVVTGSQFDPSLLIGDPSVDGPIRKSLPDKVRTMTVDLRIDISSLSPCTTVDLRYYFSYIRVSLRPQSPIAVGVDSLLVTADALSEPLAWYKGNWTPLLDDEDHGRYLFRSSADPKGTSNIGDSVQLVVFGM